MTIISQISNLIEETIKGQWGKLNKLQKGAIIGLGGIGGIAAASKSIDKPDEANKYLRDMARKRGDVDDAAFWSRTSNHVDDYVNKTSNHVDDYVNKTKKNIRNEIEFLKVKMLPNRPDGDKQKL